MTDSPAASVSLIVHPAYRQNAVESIDANVSRSAARLVVDFRLNAPVDALFVPCAGRGLFRDQLWRHTCFEVFVAARGSVAYREYNLAPSGDWAAYGFDDYRAGMHALTDTPPDIVVRRESNRLCLQAVIGGLPTTAIDLGLCAVIETRAGALSYWALSHPAAQADFHRRDGFTLAF